MESKRRGSEAVADASGAFPASNATCFDYRALRNRAFLFDVHMALFAAATDNHVALEECFATIAQRVAKGKLVAAIG
jgi:hypothetical protein